MEITDGDLEEIERFVVLLYGRTSEIAIVNDTRKHLFSYGNRKLENIPPLRAALFQQVKHASFQAGHVWGQLSLDCNAIPSKSFRMGLAEGQRWKVDTIMDNACRSF